MHAPKTVVLKTAAICLLLVLAGLPGSARADAAAADRLIGSYGAAYRQLGMAQLELSYQSNIANVLRETDLARQRSLFGDTARALAALDRDGLNACQRLDLARIGFEVDINLQKLDLVAAFRALGEQAVVGTQGLHAMPMGRQWYRYTLKRWLTSDVTPAELMDFGKTELADALRRYRRLQDSMGYAGRDRDFYAYLAGPQFQYAPGQTPQADYEAKQARVYKNLATLFLPQAIAPALVRESDRGAAFPADAYYQSDTRTFYFNRTGQSYGRRNLDMLTLHESTPGHHYQTRYADVGKSCPERVPAVFYAAFAEGWGAYVEEFGVALGLYRQPSDELGAVEWDLVRAIRVVLDVGINEFGWSGEQALDYWHAQLPMLPALAEREIARVRNWPAQAITYKYGADAIRKARAQEQARLGAAFDIRRFHDAVLRHGGLPLVLLPEAVRDEPGAVRSPL